GHRRVVGVLLEQEDVSIDMTDKNGQTPLTSGAESGSEGIV
ncbi:unnamed protein product, partial [Tuber aestivum]